MAAARITSWAAVCALLASCAFGRQLTWGEEGCAPVKGERRLLDDSAEVAMLVGHFRLVRVSTSDPRTGPIVTSAPLILRLPDSTEQVEAASRNGRRLPRALRLVGRHRWTPYEHPRGYEQVEVLRTGLAIGCATCLDGNAVGLSVHEITPRGFRGRWYDPQSGLVRAVRPDGTLRPNPAGHYCAVRVDSTASTMP